MRIFLFNLILFASLGVFSQDRVDWSYSYDKVTSQVLIKAEIAEGWHLYSQRIKNDIGPIATSFQFQKTEGIELIGTTQEPPALEEYDPNFEGELNFFKDEVTFEQQLKVNKGGILNGSVVFMVCNDTMCLPPTEIPFSIKIEK